MIFSVKSIKASASASCWSKPRRRATKRRAAAAASGEIWLKRGNLGNVHIGINLNCTHAHSQIIYYSYGIYSIHWRMCAHSSLTGTITASFCVDKCSSIKGHLCVMRRAHRFMTGGGGAALQREERVWEKQEVYLFPTPSMMSRRRPNDFNLVCIQQRMMESVSSRHKYPLNMPNSMKS